MLVNSASSDYSPIVTFAATVRVSDVVHVQVNRARVLSPGEVLEGTGAITGPIHMQALIVTGNAATPTPTASNTAVDRNGVFKPWLEQSASEPVPLVDSLLMGVPQSVGPLQFTMALPAAFDRSASWLVFRITGPAVGMPVRMADGTALETTMELPPIRVFACALQNLDGKTDKARKKAMAVAYSSGC